MWFKNLQTYRLPAPWSITKEQLEACLKPQAFSAAGSLATQSTGWVAPLEHGDLVHVADRQFLLKFCIEKKLLPSSVIAEATKLRVTELAEQQGFAPGRRQTRAIRESVTDELLARAFAVKSFTHVWIDPINGWLGIDSAADARADEIIKLLLHAVETCPITAIKTRESALSAMTSWLELDSAPTGFTVDEDTELSSGDASVRYRNNTPEPDVLQRQIASGKKCTRLGLTWQDRISFVLSANMVIKQIAPVGITEESDDADAKDAQERFDADFILMAGNFNKMLVDLLEALGGEDKQTDIVQQAAVAPGNKAAAHSGEGNDPLYDTAVSIVVSQNRALISLVQRHLRIGYNRAARLLEQMEVAKVVSVMQSNGAREVLHGRQ